MDNLYLDDIEKTIQSSSVTKAFKNKSFFITGANGMIGSFLTDVLMHLNKKYNSNITIIANTRNKSKLEKRFLNYLSNPLFQSYIGDINQTINYSKQIDYIINCASNTHPLQYSTDPIGTIITNIEGTKNVLDFAAKNKAKKTIFLSSVEIYGENINNVDRFKENEMGYIDCNSLRAGYNESKRCGEALCQAFIEKNDLDISILRLPRCYGPPQKPDDTKALSQFIHKALANEDIILKSQGNQFFSYLYVADAVSGILRCLIAGQKGEAYNLGNKKSDIQLKDLAVMIAKIANVKVKYDLPDQKEAKGFSKATIARLDYSKAEKELNYKPQYSIQDGIARTLNILKAQNTSNHH